MYRRAYIFLIVATLCWGGNAVAGKLAIGHISPMLLTFWRWAFATVIIFAISIPDLRRDWPVIRSNLPLLAFLGLVGYVVFNAALYTAVNYTTAINVTVEQTLIPVLIFLFNFVLFRMKVSWLQIVGFALTLMGGLLTAAHGDLSTIVTLSVNFGDAVMMIAIVAYAVYTVALRFRPAISWRSLMAIPALFALLGSIPAAAWEYSADRMIWPDANGWIIAVYTAVFASLIAQVLYIRGVEEIGANRAGLFINLVPVFGTLLSVIVLNENLQAFHIVALVLALGGIAIAEWGKPAQR
ncbi:EamA family transporter [Rhizobium sp. CFBP 13726]|uniref:EamA family transporter n=1 Tax=Rhizobium/Agrobacterium group TaxID=227290 RepID=UPI001785738D|nr:DMT family transporter [Rhizobium sp. CFBP 13726]